ncbi:proteophosphoglycan ppg4 [Strigomonas culicis]|uniref:Proteophosphoglycan ppg4 n=1 Tax=Strigomonas culicis TaxID=28005 RepID=S9ULD7_9TRYP|nr:proteophosphoglycan ppg4 [Strigomonas culicis]|eukprot:EPY15506.1 proteophosphoglycan ppg4 [Strigomonas culicis]
MSGTSFDLYNEQRELARVRAAIAQCLATWPSQAAHVAEAWADVLTPQRGAAHEAPASPTDRALSPSHPVETPAQMSNALADRIQGPLPLEVGSLTKAASEPKRTLSHAGPVLSPPRRTSHPSPRVPKERPPNASPIYQRRSSVQLADRTPPPALDRPFAADGQPHALQGQAPRRAESLPQTRPPPHEKPPSLHLSRSTSCASIESFSETCPLDEEDLEDVCSQQSTESLSSAANHPLPESHDLSGNVLLARRRCQSPGKPLVTPGRVQSPTPSSPHGRPAVAQRTAPPSAAAPVHGARLLSAKQNVALPPPPQEGIQTPKRSIVSASGDQTPMPVGDCTHIFSSTPAQTPDGKVPQQQSPTASPHSSASAEAPLYRGDDGHSGSSSSANSYIAHRRSPHS